MIDSLLGSFSRGRIISKVVVRNDDSVSITPIVRIRTLGREGEDDEYVNLITDTALASGHSLVWDLVPLVLRPGQELELSLEAAHTTTPPQYIISWLQDI